MTNCRECGQPTCMVLATHVAEGVKRAEDCPFIGGQEIERLKQYLTQFFPDG